MSELDMMRGAIDEIDNQIVHLFERRMAVTRQVGEYKRKISMPVLDTARNGRCWPEKPHWSPIPS